MLAFAPPAPTTKSLRWNPQESSSRFLHSSSAQTVTSSHAEYYAKRLSLRQKSRCRSTMVLGSSPLNEIGRVLDGSVGSFSVLDTVSSSMILSSSDFDPVQAQTFEPQVNTPALISFVIIAIVFSLLQFRINSVRDASLRREEALKFLRQVKSEQLNTSTSSSSNSSSRTDNQDEDKGDNNIMDKRVQDAIKAYEAALKEELNLRTIIPGVRIVAPNDAARREQDIAAAKQFLDWDILADEQQQRSESKDTNGETASKKEGDSKDLRNDLLMQSRRRFDGQEGGNTSTATNDETPMSNGAKAILLTVAVSQIALLVLLSLDPMSASNVFTDVAGTPTENLPLSSWSNQ